MGNVVTMPAPRRKRSAVLQKTDKATILLFMGVRYVRELETPDHRKPSMQTSDTDLTALNPLVIA